MSLEAPCCPGAPHRAHLGLIPPSIFMDKSHFPPRASTDQKGKCSSPRENQLHEASNLPPHLNCSLQQLGMCTVLAPALCGASWMDWARGYQGHMEDQSLGHRSRAGSHLTISSAPVTQCRVLSLLYHTHTPGCQGSVFHQGEPTGPWLISSCCHCTEPHRGIRAGARNSSGP